MLNYFYEIDKLLFYLINVNIKNKLFDIILPYITEFNNFQLLLVILFLIFFIFGNNRLRKVLILSIFLLIITSFATEILKDLTGRIRPCNMLDDINLMINCPTSYSFPSTHAANITGICLFLTLYYWKLIIPAVIIAILICLSRIYVGVHYPSDVVAGCLIGIFFATLLFLVTKRYEFRRHSLFKCYGYPRKK